MDQLHTILNDQVFPGFTSPEIQQGSPCYVSGLQGSALAAMLVSRYSSLQEEKKRVLVIMRNSKDAEMLYEDLLSCHDEDEVLYFPGLDLKPYEWRNPFGHIIEQRFQCYERMLGDGNCIVITTGQAFFFKLMSPDFITREVLELSRGQELSMEDLRSTLLHMGFMEETTVEEIGQFSMRGGIIDVYPYLLDNPVRIELWGDEIESIREFDIFTQRSIRDNAAVRIFPVNEWCFSSSELEDGLLSHDDKFEDPHTFEAEAFRLIEKKDRTGLYWQAPLFSDKSCTLLDYMKECSFIAADGDDLLTEQYDQLLTVMQKGFQEAEGAGYATARPEEVLAPREGLEKSFKNNSMIFLSDYALDSPRHKNLDISRQTMGGGSLNSVNEVFLELHNNGYRIYLLSPNAAQAQRLSTLTEEFPVSAVLVGKVYCGFISHNDKTAVFTDHQIFNRFSRTHNLKKYHRGSVPIPNFEALNKHDLIVHRDHGIGKFLGIKRMNVDSHYIDCILLSYRGNDKLTIPVSELPQIQRYSAREGTNPQLSKLGGKSWEQLKKRTRKSVEKLAKDLIELYARRSTIPGVAFPPDTETQKEFENEFMYTPTPDQITAVEEIKKDMEKPYPMDRLVCGDVGFGKTEVAMRAAFKAVLNKKQVAVLAPTTVLVSQHFSSFKDRFSNWPLSIEFLNRFKTKKEEKEILNKLQAGKVDIVIGTHRLISKDVVFKDIGLIVVDEEQKFGVKQKDKFKTYRAEVDVISLSATPIPRSMHMSMIGARDFSVIMTPPRNRLPISTRVIKMDLNIIKESLNYELSRGGQCFFVHNRIEDLPEKTLQIEKLAPNARVGMAHGQMHEKDLEQIMFAFINREYDILVSTSIIESGIDLPNVNTIIIDNAHCFGLSQLFQLRGRVGRSSVQAHCLLVAPAEEKFTVEAKKRLFSLEKFTELGSGYQLAMRDLEIRGAGNILGLKQSGHINVLGFDTYCNLLKQAVMELKNEKEEFQLDPQIDFGVNAFIPEDYVENGQQRVSLYQKISRCGNIPEVDELENELRDRFGPVPHPTTALACVMKARIMAQKSGFERIVMKNNRLQLFYSLHRQPKTAELHGIMEKLTRPFRFVNEVPMGIIVELTKGDKIEQINESLAELQLLQ